MVSTRTRRVSALISGVVASGADTCCGCCAKATGAGATSFTAAENTTTRTAPIQSIRRRDCIFPPLNLGNLDGAISRGQLSFGVANHQSDKVTARLHVEARLHGNSRAQLVGQGVVLQMHVDNLLIARDEPAISVEQAGNDGEVVLVAPIRFSEMHFLDVYVNPDRQFRIQVA